MTDSKMPAILEALDIKSLPVKDQEEILLTLGDLIFKGSLVRLIERMDDATKDEFAKLLSEDAPEERIQAFLKEKVPGGDEVVKETLDELTSDILAVTK